MMVRISPAHPFRLMFDTIIVEGGGNGDSEAEAVAEAVADAVEAVVEAVADAAPDDTDTSTEHRLTLIEVAVAAIGLKVAELEGAAQSAASTAGVALEVAQDATTPDEVEAMIEATEFEDTDHDGDIDVVDAPDEPPTGTGKSLLFANAKELRQRFSRKLGED